MMGLYRDKSLGGLDIDLMIRGQGFQPFSVIFTFVNFFAMLIGGSASSISEIYFFNVL
jgi:hypothetical protein